MTTSTAVAVVPLPVLDVASHDLAQLTDDLHDTVAHALSGIALAAAGACRALGDPAGPVPGHLGADDGPLPRALGALRAIEACAMGAMTDLHALLGLLRTDAQATGDADLTHGSPGLADLGTLVARARAAGLPVALDERGHRRALTRRVDHVAFRVVQEGLTNAIKYAGAATPVQVRIRWSGVGVEVTVRTLDAHHDPHPGERLSLGGTGQGLAGLARRVIGVSGRFTAGPSGPGFLTEALLPIARGRSAGARAGSTTPFPATRGA